MSRTMADLTRLTVGDLLPSIKQQRQNPRSPITGQRTIPRSDGGEPVHLAFVIESEKADYRVRLKLKHVAQGNGGTVSGEDTVQMHSTEPGFGGQRWWFVCPDCRQKRAYLVLTSSGARFVCRACAETPEEP